MEEEAHWGRVVDPRLVVFVVQDLGQSDLPGNTTQLIFVQDTVDEDNECDLCALLTGVGRIQVLTSVQLAIRHVVLSIRQRGLPAIVRCWRVGASPQSRRMRLSHRPVQKFC